MATRNYSFPVSHIADEKTPNTQQFDRGGPRAHVILTVMTLLLMINYMDRQVLSSVLELMKNDLHLTDTQAGSLQTAFLISLALFSFPISYMVDRWSRRKAIGIMAIVWSVFTYLTGMANSFLGVFLPRSAVGVGEAAFQAGGTAWITASYGKHLRGRMMGIFNGAIPLGSAIGVVLGGWIATKYGSWRTPFYIFAIPGILLGVITFFLKDYKTAQSTGEEGERVSFLSSIGTLFRIRTLKWLYIGFAMQNVLVFSFMTWTPAYLMRTQQLDASKAGMIVGLVSMMAVIGVPMGGIIADKWQLKNPRARMLLPALCLGLGSVLYIVALLYHLQGMGLIMFILFGLFIVVGLPAMSAVTQDVVPPSLKGTAWGLNVFCMYIFGGGWRPYL